jgi:cysteine synthase
MIAAALGYPVKLYLPQSASDERKRILQAYGAELVMTPGDEGTDAGRKKAIFGALRLYLDFINLFLSILRLTGRRR